MIQGPLVGSKASRPLALCVLVVWLGYAGKQSVGCNTDLKQNRARPGLVTDRGRQLCVANKSSAGEQSRRIERLETASAYITGS